MDIGFMRKSTRRATNGVLPGRYSFFHRGDVPVQKFDSLGDDLYPTKEEAIQAGAAILRDKIDVGISQR